MIRTALRGVFAAVLTPFDVDFNPDERIAAPYYRSLLERGCSGINLLGTTGEAFSLSTRQRRRFMEDIAASVSPQCMMVGTGASALADAVELTRAALDLGYRAALVIPPFYYRDANEAGMLRFFAALFGRADAPEESVMLYNFPRMSGFTFTADFVEALATKCPGIVCGVKDSSNSLELETQVAQRMPGLAVFPGSEALLADAKARSLSGCISGSVCLWPESAARVWRDTRANDQAELAAMRERLETPLIPAVRRALAAQTQNSQWLRSAPPLA